MQEAMYLCQGNMADAYAIMSVLLEVGDKENWAYNNIFDGNMILKYFNYFSLPHSFLQPLIMLPCLNLHTMLIQQSS